MLLQRSALHHEQTNAEEEHAQVSTAKVTVVFHLEVDVLDRDEDQTQFFIEENHCIDNLVRQLHEMLERNPGYCTTCPIAEAYVGHIPFDAIQQTRKGELADARRERDRLRVMIEKLWQDWQAPSDETFGSTLKHFYDEVADKSAG